LFLQLRRIEARVNLAWSPNRGLALLRFVSRDAPTRPPPPLAVVRLKRRHSELMANRAADRTLGTRKAA